MTQEIHTQEAQSANFTEIKIEDTTPATKNEKGSWCLVIC
ncbi:unnamed protein product, partial [Brachionus calyciflorus]